MAKQIDHQRYLLEREARRCERRRRRNERIRFRDLYATAMETNANESKRSTGTPRHNTDQNSDDSITVIDVRLFFLLDFQSFITIWRFSKIVEKWHLQISFQNSVLTIRIINKETKTVE